MKVFVGSSWTLGWVMFKLFFKDYLLNKFLQKTRSVSTANCIPCSSNRLWHKKGAVSTWRQKGTFLASLALSPIYGRIGRGKMVNSCVAAGSSNTHSDRVSLFKFPSDTVLRHKWEKQVQRMWGWRKATEHSVTVTSIFPKHTSYITYIITFTYPSIKSPKSKTLPFDLKHANILL